MKRLVLITLSCSLLAACGRDLPAPAEPSAPQPAPSAEAAAPLVDTAVPVGLNAPIPPEQIATRLELAGAPRYVAASDTLELLVRVHNDGQATLTSEGSAMVNLGAMLVGPEGPDVTPGVRDFIRAPLPLLAPYTQAEIPMSLPAQPLIGLPIRLELVQEGVSWFGAYGQPSLDIGPFQRCDGMEGTLCTTDGQALQP